MTPNAHLERFDNPAGIITLKATTVAIHTRARMAVAQHDHIGRALARLRPVGINEAGAGCPARHMEVKLPRA